MEQEAIIEPKKSIIHFFRAGIFLLLLLLFLTCGNWSISKIKDDFSSVSFALLIFILQLFSFPTHAFIKSKMTLSADISMSV